VIINKHTFEYNGACKDEVSRFCKLWPDGLELNAKNLELVREHEFQIWLPGVSLYNMDFQGANLRGANLLGANLEEANLERANLSRVHLYRADLRGANLRGADLNRADLEGAIFRNTDLSGANMPKVILSEVQRSNCVGLDCS